MSDGGAETCPWTSMIMFPPPRCARLLGCHRLAEWSNYRAADSAAARLLAAKQAPENRGLYTAARRVGERRFWSRAASEMCPCVGERLETGARVVGAHPTCADTAEGQTHEREVLRGGVL